MKQSLRQSTPLDQMARLEVAERAHLLQDLGRMCRSEQALVDRMNQVQAGVEPPGDDVINLGNITINEPEPQQTTQRKGLSALAAVGLGFLAAAVPAAGVLGYMLKAAPAVEKIIRLPGTDYDVGIDMEVIPPGKK